LSKRSCGVFVEFSIVHKTGYNIAIHVRYAPFCSMTHAQRDANFIIPLLTESQFSQDSLVANFRLPSAFAMDRHCTVDAKEPPIRAPGASGACFLQAVQFLAVQVRVERLAIGEQLIVDNSLPIPPNKQKNIPGSKKK